MEGKYREQYELLHKEKNYGVSSERLVNDIYQSIIRYYPKMYKSLPMSIIDYGCGQSGCVDKVGSKLALLHKDIGRYDFAIEKYSTLPSRKYSFGICTDVLEHIPEEEIGENLERLRALAKMWYITISLVEAFHSLPNGENCHCTVQPSQWWEGKLKEYFSSIVPNGGNDTHIRYIIY